MLAEVYESTQGVMYSRCLMKLGRVESVSINSDDWLVITSSSLGINETLSGQNTFSRPMPPKNSS